MSSNLSAPTNKVFTVGNNMITIQGSIPRNVVVACSGGVDSMVIVDFLSHNHYVKPLFVHHGTDTSEQAYEFLKNKFGKRLFTAFITEEKLKNQSQEEFWRNERYKIFHSIGEANGGTVVTGHHLNDCVETWVWSSMHGEGKIIPYNNRNVIRPFRLTPKSEFYAWAHRKDVEYVEDVSNTDTSYTRNYIRHVMMPHILKVNPGIEKTIKKKIING